MTPAESSVVDWAAWHPGESPLKGQYDPRAGERALISDSAWSCRLRLKRVWRWRSGHNVRSAAGCIGPDTPCQSTSLASPAQLVSIGCVVVFVRPLLMHEDSLAVKALLCFSLTHLLFCFSGTFHPERLQSKKKTGSARPLLLFGLSLSPQEPCAQHTQAAMLNKMELLYI